MDWDIVIGIETHVQLRTNTKQFSGASTKYGSEPNSQACLVSMAYPGVLPVLNKESVNSAIRFYHSNKNKFFIFFAPFEKACIRGHFIYNKKRPF